MAKIKELKEWFSKPRRCSPDCPIFPCWAQPASLKNPDHECAIYRLTEKEKARVIMLHALQEENFDSVIIDYLSELMFKAKGEDWRAQRAVLHDLLKVKETIFGKRHKIEGKVDGELTISKLKEIIYGEEGDGDDEDAGD